MQKPFSMMPALAAVLCLALTWPAMAQKNKKLSLAELAALEWKLEQAGNTLAKNADAAARLKALEELASLKDLRAVKPLAMALREDPQGGVRAKAAEALAAFKTPEAKGLLTVVSSGDPDPAVRSKAATLLKGFPRRMMVATIPVERRTYSAPKGKITLAQVQKALKLPSGDARLWAIRQLKTIKGAEGVKLLKKHLAQDPSSRVRIESAQLLVALEKKKALPLLVKAIEDGDPGVRFELAHLVASYDDGGALMVLQKLTSSDGDATVKAEARDLLEPSTPVGRRLLKVRIKKLSSANPAERIAALEELDQSTHWRAMTPMSCTLLQDKSSNVRAAAAKVLTDMHDTTVLTAMRIAAVMEPDSKLQSTIRKMLTGMRQRVDDLLKQLKSDDPSQRIRAARAIGQGAYPPALGGLIQALKDKDPRVRLTAVRGLANFTDAKAQNALKMAGTDADQKIRTVVDRHFKKLQQVASWRGLYKDANRLAMKTTDKDPVWRFDAAIALGIMGAESAVGNVAQLLLHDKEEAVRHAAAWALVLMANERAENALKVAAAKDPSQKIRLTARKYLIISKVSLEDLLSQLVAEDTQVRIDAAEALSLRPSGKALNHLLRAAICDPEPRVRSAALRGLARIGNPMARDIIKTAMARDTDARVRRTAMVMYILAGGN